MADVDDTESSYLPYDDPPEYASSDIHTNGYHDNEQPSTFVLHQQNDSSHPDALDWSPRAQEHDRRPHSDGLEHSHQFSHQQYDPASLNFNGLRLGEPDSHSPPVRSHESLDPSRAASVPPATSRNRQGVYSTGPDYISDHRFALHPEQPHPAPHEAHFQGITQIRSQYPSSSASLVYETAQNGDAMSEYSQHGSALTDENQVLGGYYSHTASTWAPQQPVLYDPLYAAASSVLGGPPSDGATWNTSQPSLPHLSSSSTYSDEYRRPSLPNNPYPANRKATGNAIPFSPSSAAPSSSFEPIARSQTPDSVRPSLRRADETFSPMPGTRKSKAIDVNHPPYTRKYVEEYRVRIKGDPDPEAHFRYAKYLIDAAKKIGSDAADQKAVRKYRDGLVVESLKVIRRLATQGETFPEAQFFLANCHGTGMLGLQIDHERAYHLYLQAAKQNHPSAAYRVAVCNEIGAGTRRDASRAFAFYRKAASLGDTPAMYKLGMILLSGSLNQAKNPREAIGWLKRAAEQADEENPHALHELGLLHELPNSTIVVHDDAYAKELFTRAANLGYTQSQFKLGQCYEFGSPTCPIDPRKSIAWYTKAAEKGDPEAELALSGWYLTGSEGVLKQSDSEAYLWARRAANKGLSKAEYAVGYYAEVGIGVKQDLELAKRWYMRSAAQGNKRAMNRLTEMKRDGSKKRSAARPTRQQANKEECIIC